VRGVRAPPAEFEKALALDPELDAARANPEQIRGRK
jgi:hypothetical protein